MSPLIQIQNLDLFAEPPFRNYFNDNSPKNTEGATAFLTQPNTIILPQELATQYQVSAGDNITLELAGKDINVRIVGLINPANNLTRSALSSIVFTDIATAQEILGTVGHLSHIDLILDNQEQQSAIEKILPIGIKLDTYVLAWILIYVINVRSFGWTLQMQLQPSYFLQAFAVAVIAAILAGIYPAWCLGNTVIASAIRQE